MPPETTNNFGQFGTAIPGGVDNVKAALERRGLGGEGAALDQVSAGAAGAPPPSPVGNTPESTGNRINPSGQQPEPVSETTIILKALSERLKSDSKIKEFTSGVASNNATTRSRPATTSVPRTPAGII